MRRLLSSAPWLVSLSLLGACGGGSPNLVPPPPPLVITSGPPPAGTTGSKYGGSSGFDFTASGGIAPYKWSWAAATNSSLPAGLTLSGNSISGTPTTAGSFGVVVKVTDSESPTAQKSASYAINIDALASTVVIISGAPPNGTVGANYGSTFSCVWSPVLGWHLACTPCDPSIAGSCPSVPCPTQLGSPKHCLSFVRFMFTATGGASPYTWSSSGMPPGLNVDRRSGEISGTPTTAGNYPVSVTLSDSESPPAQLVANYTIEISPSSGLNSALEAPTPMVVSDQVQHHYYKLIDLGTFGGAQSAINMAVDINSKAVNRHGTTVGFSATSFPKLPTSNPLICGGDDGFGASITHAFGWLDGAVKDLGSLPPTDTDCSNAYQVNDSGEIVGFSENGQVDPLTGFNQSRAIRWVNGRMGDLGSFGGNQNEALALNNHGQIVGFSLNSIFDPFSFFDFLLLFPNPPNGTQTRAFLWQRGQMQDLGTLGTGNDAAAFMINDRGQIAGISYTNSTPNSVTGIPQVDPFFWDRGTMMDIGTFGGAFGQPNYLNNRGQLVGGLSVPADPGACFFEDYPNCHPFLWEKGNLRDLATTSKGGVPQTADGINDAGKIIGGADFSATGGSPFDGYLWSNGVANDLGTLLGDCGSRAMSINSQGQIVGHAFSCPDFNFHHALLWEDRSMVDLNTVIPKNSSLELAFANDINDRGEIAGMGVPPGVDPANVFTEGHAYLLIPCDENHPDVEGCDYKLVDVAAAAQSAVPRDLPSGMQRTPQARRINHYHIPGLQLPSK